MVGLGRFSAGSRGLASCAAFIWLPGVATAPSAACSTAKCGAARGRSQVNQQCSKGSDQQENATEHENYDAQPMFLGIESGSRSTGLKSGAGWRRAGLSDGAESSSPDRLSDHYQQPEEN
jgi:hypothetical protein